MNAEPLPTEMTTVTAEVVTRKPRKRELKNLTRREGIWYFHKRVNGKKEFNGRATPFSLETRDLVVAKAKRAAILKAANGATVDRLLGRDSRNAAKCSEIFEAYTKTPTVRANARTRKNNIADLKRMVRVVRGAEFNVAEMSSTELNWKLVNQWQTLRLAIATKECGQDLAQLEAKKRSFNSLLTHVQSLFSKEALAAYRGLHLPPNIDEFLKALPIPARKQEEPTQLTDQFVSDLLRAVVDLQGIDAGAWAAFQLMTWGGLRNKECLHARKTWLEEIPMGYRLMMRPTEDFLPKGDSRAVILPAAIVAGMFAQMKEGDDHLVPARTKTDRHDACYRRLNQWLKARGVGEDANKIAYRLRKYFLAKVAEQQGVFLAQAAAGHASQQTTQNHYIGKPKMAAPIKLRAARKLKIAPIALLATG